MKIAVWHNLPSGGGKRALYDQVRGLLNRGHHMEAWCPPTADQTYFPLSELIPEHIVPLKQFSKDAKNPLKKLLVLSQMTVGKMKALDLHCQQCAKEINRREFDLLFAGSTQGYAVSPVARHVNIPKIIYLQEPYRLLYEASPLLPWIAPQVPEKIWRKPKQVKNLLFDFFAVQWLRVQAREEHLNAAAFDTILVNSFFSRESVLRAYGLDAKVCYLGVDTNKFYDHKEPKENFIVGIGAITPRKNIRFILDALAHISSPRPKLIWVGNAVNEDYLNHLKIFAQSVGVSFEVRVSVSEDELINILNHAMMLVCAPRLEPFGYTPLEANACGLPVIAVAEGGLRETVIDGVNGLLVDSNPRAMAEGIERLIKDKSYARQLGENGSKLVDERWSLEASIERLEKHLLETLEKPDKKSGELPFDKNEYWKKWTME